MSWITRPVAGYDPLPDHSLEPITAEDLTADHFSPEMRDPMQRHQDILVEVWREACQHIEINESAGRLAAILEHHLPLVQIVVLRFDQEHQHILTVGVAPNLAPGCALPPPRGASRRELSRLVAWAGTGEILNRGRAKGLPGLLSLLVTEAGAGDVVAAPLKTESGQCGALLLFSTLGRVFDQKHRSLARTLQEPLSTALENDRRLHELAALREAAEADRRSLLNRLGRTEMGDTIVGHQTGLRQVMERVDLVGKSDVPVLILGETGTGKELVARAIHNRSDRSTGPFIRVNCGAIPHELIDSQLFGHERGAFTGANETRQGWFERADGGTLFLDEVGELPLNAQVRFLRVLQDGFVERVGGQQSIHVDVRIVAATHRDLAFMVREGRFREDLWYRIAVFPILLPPLRERRSDIADLARHFAQRAAVRFGLAAVEPSPEDFRLLEAYHWPGNIRELGAVIDRAAILGDGESLEIATALGAPERRSTPPHDAHHVTAEAAPTGANGGIVTLAEAMRRHIEAALAATRGRIEGPRGAAALLAINPHTLRARMRKLGVKWASYRD